MLVDIELAKFVVRVITNELFVPYWIHQNNGKNSVLTGKRRLGLK